MVRETSFAQCFIIANDIAVQTKKLNACQYTILLISHAHILKDKN